MVSSLAIWSAHRTSRDAERVASASRLDDRYQDARRAVADEAAAGAAYRTGRAPAACDGGAGDRRVAPDIARSHEQYLRLDARSFGAIDRNQRSAGSGIGQRDREVAALFTHVRTAVDEAAADHRSTAAARLDRLRSTTQLVALIMPGACLACLAGLALVAFFTSVMVSYRHQAKAAADFEIARLEQVAHTDNLTGLGNHRALHDAVPLLADEYRITGITFTVFAFDLDGLKAINDSRGHTEGDGGDPGALEARRLRAQAVIRPCYVGGGCRPHHGPPATRTAP